MSVTKVWAHETARLASRKGEQIDGIDKRSPLTYGGSQNSKLKLT